MQKTGFRSTNLECTLAFFRTLGQDAGTSEAWLLRFKSSVYLISNVDLTRGGYQDSARLLGESC